MSTPLDRSLLEALRHGLAGDANSVRLLARTLLRKPPEGVRDAEAFRETLSRLLVDETGGARAMRGAAAPPRRPLGRPMPLEEDSQLSLLRAEDVNAAERPILSAANEEAIGNILRERGNALDLEARGVYPTKTLLLTGAPGVGKTMTARYLARCLGLPLLVMDLSVVVSSYLGRTGYNLRQILDAAHSAPCVLLLDEFDALAKRRNDDSDIGELKRIVNVLLVELDRWPAHSLLVAATNHPELLDPAIWRRFDCVIDLDLPDEAARRLLIGSYISRVGVQVNDDVVDIVTSVSEGASGSDLARLVRGAGRHAILDRLPTMDRPLLSLAARDGKNGEPLTERTRELFSKAASEAGMSQREIADVLGVSHPTVGRLIKRSQSRNESPRGKK